MDVESRRELGMTGVHMDIPASGILERVLARLGMQLCKVNHR